MLLIKFPHFCMQTLSFKPYMKLQFPKNLVRHRPSWYNLLDRDWSSATQQLCTNVLSHHTTAQNCIFVINFSRKELDYCADTQLLKTSYHRKLKCDLNPLTGPR